MDQFEIKSTVSSNKIIFSSLNGDYFNVELKGDLCVKRNVYAYTDAKSLCNLLVNLSEVSKPWEGKRHWESIEGEFLFDVICDSAGHVTFLIELNQIGVVEEWRVNFSIVSEFGQLSRIAENATKFWNIN